jgi:glycosyltransferase involved in cell wall biosynthesis
LKFDVFVSVVVPIADDADVLAEFVEEATALLKENYKNYELIFVDDGSTDETPGLFNEILEKKPSIRYIRLPRHFGLEVSISAGLDNAIGDVVVVLRPASDPVNRLPDFVAKARENHGVVVGVRDEVNTLPFSYRFNYGLFHAASKMFLDFPPIRYSTYYMAFTRTSLNALLRIKDKYRALRVLGLHAGFKVDTLSYKVIQRRETRRKRSFGALLENGVSTIVSNSTRPLRWASVIGMLCATMNTVYIAYIFFSKFMRDKIASGWASSSLQNSVMFTLLFLLLVIVCEYLGRLLDEVKSRPLYFIDYEKHSSEMLAEPEVKNVVKD